MSVDSSVLFDPRQLVSFEDLYSVYARLQREQPVHRTHDGVWVLTRYEDVALALRDPRLGRRGFAELLEARLGRRGVGKSMLYRDPPDHTRLRALVMQAFTPRAVENMRERIRTLVANMLDRIAEHGGRVDLLTELALPLPVLVICHILGLPAQDAEMFRNWTDGIVRASDVVFFPDAADVERANEGLDAIRTYLVPAIEARRRNPGDDLVSALIAAQEGQDKLSPQELLSMTAMLFVAGHETTVNLIANGLLAILRHPAELERLRNDPSLIGRAVEECLRYDSPVQRASRMTHEAFSVRGATIPSGAVVLAVIGAANRDPHQFPDPDRFDIGRADNPHLAFGAGIHYCLGASLARLEAQIAIGAVIRRFPRIALTDASPSWRRSWTFRGLTTLPVDV
jgi:pimeloyl-[acyl-carrier protein] synthase